MNLFLKIFLWFLAAITLMIGVVVFLNWTVQTEPVVSRWQTSVRNQMNIYAATAAQIYDTQGDDGVKAFLDRVGDAGTVGEVAVISRNRSVRYGGVQNAASYGDLIDSAFLSDTPQLERDSTDTALSARGFTLNNGERYALVVRWERPRAPAFFGDSSVRYVRYGVLLLTAILLCYALARYLSTPIGKLRDAAQKLAAGDLKTRVDGKVGRRRDELSDLAKDFDVMAERIESLVMSQKRLSRDVSHELRSPLARMNVALEIAKQKSNGELSPMLERIETESGRLNEMISRLLTLSRLETGTRDFKSEEIDLAEMVEQIVDDADFEARAKNKTVKIVHMDRCRVEGNESLLQSAVENVLRNAVKYTDESTAVEVSVTAAATDVTIAVRDHGEGVPDEELTNLFRAFYRVGEARERKTGGIGLGLAIAQQAVAAHNGTITAQNTGNGLLVEIVLKRKMDVSGNYNS
ncbi:MAG: ATP-binding protein [Acidobacteriota bacterium]